MCLLSNYIQAQKVKSQTVNGTSIHYPIVALPASMKTYTVKSNRMGLDSIEFNRVKSPAERILLEGFSRVASNADLMIRLHYGNLKLYQFASPTVIKSIDDLKGASFNTIIEYTIEVTFEVLDSRNVVIQKETYLSGSSFKTGGTTDIPRRQAKATEVVGAVTTAINEGIEACNVRIKDLFDTYREKHPLEFYAVKPSKTETYDDYATAVKTLEGAFAQSSDGAALVKAIEPSLEFWKKKMTTLNPSAHEDEKSYYFLCTYNLAAAYCYLDDFDKSVAYLDKAKANDYKPGYVGLLRNEVTKRKKMKDQYLADKAKVESNPESIYLKSESANTTPSSVFDLGKKTSTTATTESNYLEQGFLILSTGDTTFGKFVEFDVNLNKGLVSFVPNGGTRRDFHAPYAAVRFASIRGEVYSFGKNGKTRVVYASEQLVVLSTSPTDVWFKFGNREPVLYKTFDSNDGASFVTNYKKKLAEVIKGTCATVEEKVLKGTYDLKKEGVQPLEPFIRDYENECGSKRYEENRLALDPVTVRKTYR
ncbi:hypothetical protein DQQ10_06225 [Pseudochryseolinea flava]|uniref:Uncharacterized protein n=2 Tax=Pseudochryseolinea flava TaxID=2059302 RepID=A0A364Y8F8_9BACT|nr:hypothetical protein DQQ10_06225 [Pseudochryseolinea flava]